MKDFKLSVSTKCFSDKNDINWGGVKYQTHTLSIDNFIELIREGYCFCHCFSTNDEVFGVINKTNANFKEAYMVFVDIDNSIKSMGEFITLLSHKPTIAYTTPNNFTDKSGFAYRFRLCYLLDKPISVVKDYEEAYRRILGWIEHDVKGFENKDNCGSKPSQQFSGNAKANCEVWKGDEMYNSVALTSTTHKRSLFDVNTTPSQQNFYGNVANITDKAFIDDFNILSPLDFMRKYAGQYQYFDRTPLEYRDGYAILPPDYTQIRRKCTYDSFYKDNGEIKTWIKAKKIRDGEGRRRKLYISALIRKQILPNITIEHLLFNLVWDRYYFFDNSDKVLSNKLLLDYAIRVINTPFERIKLPLFRPKEYEVDKEYCLMYGIAPNEMKNRVRRILTDQKIGEAYDCSLSVMENLKMFKEMGIKVGKSRLYQWCRENGISSNPLKDYIDLPSALCECCYVYPSHSSSLKRA